MDEIVTSLKAALYERLSSPLFSSFILSWIGWNYKFFFVAFSDLSPKDKFTAMETEVFTHNFFSIGSPYADVLAIPLLISITFLILYPLPALGASWIWTKFQNGIKKIKDKNLLSEKESRIMRQKMIQLESFYDGLLKEKDNKLQEHENIVSSLRDEHEETINNIQNALTAQESEIDELNKALEKANSDEESRLKNYKNTIEAKEIENNKLKAEIVRLAGDGLPNSSYKKNSKEVLYDNFRKEFPVFIQHNIGDKEIDEVIQLLINMSENERRIWEHDMYNYFSKLLHFSKTRTNNLLNGLLEEEMFFIDDDSGYYCSKKSSKFLIDNNIL